VACGRAWRKHVKGIRREGPHGEGPGEVGDSRLTSSRENPTGFSHTHTKSHFLICGYTQHLPLFFLFFLFRRNVSWPMIQLRKFNEDEGALFFPSTYDKIKIITI